VPPTHNQSHLADLFLEAKALLMSESTTHRLHPPHGSRVRVYMLCDAHCDGMAAPVPEAACGCGLASKGKLRGAAPLVQNMYLCLHPQLVGLHPHFVGRLVVRIIARCSRNQMATVGDWATYLCALCATTMRWPFQCCSAVSRGIGNVTVRTRPCNVTVHTRLWQRDRTHSALAA
jgi:hypothetical protein